MAMRNPGPMPPQRMAWPTRNFGQPRFTPNPRAIPAFGQQAGPTANRGLLTKLFSRQAAAPEAASMFARSGGAETSLLQGLTNPQTIGSFLGKTQNVLNTAQQFGPLIQQYGPMVKNLPAMWRIYQGLTSAGKDDANESSNNSNNEQMDDILKESSETIKEQTATQEEKTNSQTKKREQGKSVPKLYIPS